MGFVEEEAPPSGPEGGGIPGPQNTNEKFKEHTEKHGEFFCEFLVSFSWCQFMYYSYSNSKLFFHL